MASACGNFHEVEKFRIKGKVAEIIRSNRKMTVKEKTEDDNIRQKQMFAD